MDLLVAPTERPPIANMGTSSIVPEQHGVDLMWENSYGMFGAQRKEISDLVASVRDGRLGKELVQMKSLRQGFLIVEGTPSWDLEGNLVGSVWSGIRWTIRQHNGVLLSAQSQGVLVLTSKNSLDTCAVVEYLYGWTQKDEHVSSLLARPGPPKNGWGDLTDRDTAIHIYSGFPSVGPTLAARIYDAGIRLVKAGTTVDELMTLPGIGKAKASAILSSIES